ncbi:relaxase domain-containing protein [Janibacter hoylei]|uniref:MobF family relaxase n=1 Tax=Janibacter hoylei TaxID=364298 RepID=UPI002238FFE8|nr:MobF family relaxase [Janibacter hoylei]MCW4600185.1 relaxase domain-containing protein [Janibacter hoylei]
MSLHKLTAGGGYDYLTRQVAAHDSTELGSRAGLASYYTERGETPGQWVGSGMTGLEGLAAGDVVTADQMHNLFGLGIHPLAQERSAVTEQAGAPDVDEHSRLGLPFKVYKGEVSDFRIEVARALTAWNVERDMPRDHAVPINERARIRSEIGAKFFREEHGRDPRDARELAASIAKNTRPKTTAVAGFDLTFSPVKSVSSLWALADPALAARIELAHQAAIKDALTFIEDHALYSRTGANGVRQVDVQGLVATAFTHRDSRSGDPDLHTHVAVANKVRTQDDRWLSIDGRVLYKGVVAASETYNTSLERHLTRDLGVRFAERANPDPRKRPVREIVGVDPALNERWSARRVSIQARRAQLARDFQTTHGRPPSPVESIKLAQQATLETRGAKHEPRTLTEQRLQWRGQAREVLGSDEAIRAMVSRSVGAGSDTQLRVTRVTRSWVSETSQEIRAAMQSRRSTWQTWHVRAEALRRVRALEGLAPEAVEDVVQRLTTRVLEHDSVLLTRNHDPVTEPAALTRADGESVYSVHGSAHYTSTDILAAERRIVAASGRHSAHTVDSTYVDLALLESTANGVALNAGQASLVREMATSPACVQLAIAPAGAGKTTAMRALSSAWTNGGGQVLGLAPSAAAAAVLGEQIDVATDTLAKLVWSLENDPGNLPEWAQAVDRTTLLVIDEAGMADTLSLDSVITFALERGAKVRLIGDDQQLAAIGAGGVLRDIEASQGALRLNELMRFRTPGEGSASLAMREGRPEAIGFYLDHQRVHVGDLSTMTDEVFDSWRADRGEGRDSIMLAPTRDLVAQLNSRARGHRLEGADAGPSVRLSDGLEASVGDQVITRVNDRRLRVSPTDWVKNGDRWQVVDVHDSGSITVQHLRHQRMVTLPADYVAQSTELGYASTVHGAQGVSVDASHALVTDQIARQSLYTAMTRGAHENHVYLEVVGDGDERNVIRPETVRPQTATDLLEGILARDDSLVSATTQMRVDADPAPLLGNAVARYTDALHFAAEDLLGPEAVADLERRADKTVPGVSAQPAWPALRAHLILLSAHGVDPIVSLREATQSRPLDDAIDAAAVLDWRLDDSGHRGAGSGPLPWLPGIPRSLSEHDTWGAYLGARSDLVAETADRVRAGVNTQPPWAREVGVQLPPRP